MSSSIHVLPPDDTASSSWAQGFYPSSLLTGGWQGMVNTLFNKNPRFPPLDVLPCANVEVEKYTACDKPGKQACSGCKLVSYCSKECQKAHWGVHKRDCKDPIKSNTWKPKWMVEGRKPIFILKSNISAAEEFEDRIRDRLSLGVSFWGNMPAMDIVNLPNNEKDPKTNLWLAFAASGDIRNVVATVNALGSEHSGQLNILLNDGIAPVVSRNIILLLILGTIPDEAMAADIALHFWYSVFMPMEYRLKILSMVTSLLRKSPGGPIAAPLGPRSTLTCLVSAHARQCMMANASPGLSLEQAQTEYRRVRTAPSRVDFRDRMYMGLGPSHRLAFLEYRRFGMILPFGAPNAHCNVPNPSLFSNGKWFQTDFADPLESWDLDEVFRSGKAHGAQPEDVYGCLYFFVSDQLRAFARHLRQRPISFYVFDSEACELARDITRGKYTQYGVPSTVRFDRIDVSNILDPNYVGIRNVLKAWGSLLAKSSTAALTGYFMNWVMFTQNGRVADCGPSVITNTLALMARSNQVRPGPDPMLTIYLAMEDIDAFHDNWKAFSKFLKDHGADDAQRETGLRLRTKHRILPHRLGTAVDGKPDALPQYPDDETWYRYMRLINRTWTERFVEFGHSEG